ncbi:MAG: hypothetical protein PVF45_06115 [Anaerolineae bacterium]|jgi:hypothetical protein
MMAEATFFKATTIQEREAVNRFLARHNQRGQGSTRGYVAYYAATYPPNDGRPLVDRIAAAAKFCPLHTPQAARFFGGDDWRHVYCLQRLAAYRAPKNLLSRFLAWCLRDMGRDPKVYYVATYADSGSFDERDGRPHNGGIYRATNAVYCGVTQGGRVEGFFFRGCRRSMRNGPRTYTVARLRQLNERARLLGRPEPVRLIRSRPMHRYCWPVGTPLKRAFRRRTLESRMDAYRFEAACQPRLLLTRLGRGMRGLLWAVARML